MIADKEMLIVDDIELNRIITKELFYDEYKFFEASNGMEALEIIKQRADTLTIILLDIVMPIMDGVKLLEELERLDLIDKVPIVVITADNNPDIEAKVLDMGVTDIVTKPFIPHLVKRRIQNAVRAHLYKKSLENIATDLNRQVRESNQSLIEILLGIIEHRSLETTQHNLRIRKFTETLLREVANYNRMYDLDEEKIQIIAEASALHDIGKIVIPNSILNKPGRLTKEEFDIIKTHTTEGGKIIQKIINSDRSHNLHTKSFLEYAYDIATYHHERYDGKGYPSGLTGKEIPIWAQVAGIADVYDALTTPRVYKEAYLPDAAIDMILNGECGTFSKEVLNCFTRVTEEYEHLAIEYGDVYFENDSVKLPDTTSETFKQIKQNSFNEDGIYYRSLIDALDVLVIEVDFDRNERRIENSTNKYFKGLSKQGKIDENFQSFLNNWIYEPDRKNFQMFLNKCRNDVLNNINIVNKIDLKIYDYNTSQIQDAEITVSKIDLNNNNKHRAIIICMLK